MNCHVQIVILAALDEVVIDFVDSGDGQGEIRCMAQEEE
jgi:hypothetical protein